MGARKSNNQGNYEYNHENGFLPVFAGTSKKHNLMYSRAIEPFGENEVGPGTPAVVLLKSRIFWSYLYGRFCIKTS